MKLKNLVRKGEVSLQVAQDAIRRNWVAAYGKYVGLSGVGTWVGEEVERIAAHRFGRPSSSEALATAFNGL